MAHCRLIEDPFDNSDHARARLGLGVGQVRQTWMLLHGVLQLWALTVVSVAKDIESEGTGALVVFAESLQ